VFKKVSLLLAFALSCVSAGAQTVTLPARTVTQTVTLNGRSAQLTFTIPAQTVLIPKPAVVTPPLPTGITFSNGVLTVAGSISATALNLTGGATTPVSASGLYLLQLTDGFFHPVPYVPYVPAVTP
jgi:hypothetical protein